MGLSDDLKKEVKEIFAQQWTIRDGNVIPDNDDIKLSNDGVKLEATVLYTDLAESTKLVDSKKSSFAAEVYKAFLRSACKIISDCGGEITAFDGDRVMGVFIGGTKNTSAVRAALRINYAVLHIVNPALRNQYTSSDYVIQHGTGVDCSDILVTRSGIRGSNDLVWIGPAANYAAKLSALRSDGYSTWISQAVFNKIRDEMKYDSQRKLMWESRTWTQCNQTIYRSNYYQSF